MKDLVFCDEWGEKLAARHPDDLSSSDQTALCGHLAECPQCATAYAAFKAMEVRMQAFSKVGPLPPLLPKLQEIEQSKASHKKLSKSNLQIRVQCLDRSFEVLPDEVENAELMVEDAMSKVLLELFDGGTIDDVTIIFSPDLRVDLQQCSIQIHAWCRYQSFVLLPHTKENIEQAVAKRICSILKELFGSVKVESVRFGPFQSDYENDPARSCQRFRLST